MYLLLLTIIVHFNNVHLPFTPTYVAWLPRLFATVAKFPAPNGCGINLCFLPSSCSDTVFLCYVDLMCNLIFAPPMIFYGYKLLECYLSPKSLTKGVIFPFTIYDLSRKVQKKEISKNLLVLFLLICNFQKLKK
jgi:hypothetical protein